MIDEEILEKAIDKASQHGYEANKHYLARVRSCYAPNHAVTKNAVMQILFDHEFAKALWGDTWQIHLQQMVIAANPAIYLREHLND